MYRKLLLVASVLAIFIILPCLTMRTRSRAGYGEFCNNQAIRCDSSLSLTCKNQTCVCLKPEYMIFDPILRSCASLAGEKCKFTVMEEYRSWQEEVSCVNHAHCDFPQSVCVCDKDFIELSNGTCIPRKNFNESCEASSDCKQDASLICKNSKCICNAATSEYSSEFSQCVGLANEPCVNDLCTANAICREEPRRVYYGGSSVEIEVSSDEDYSELVRDPASIGRCQCRTAFGVTPGGKCLMGYGGKCDHEHAKCMEWLRCKEGTCVCQFPTHQVYDKTTESCVSHVGGPCTDPESNVTESQFKFGCVPGAICAKIQDSPRFQCICPEGFIENRERSCDLSYGSMCKTQHVSPYATRHAHQTGSASSTPHTKCDRIGKLYCIDGVCQCEDTLHMYDKGTRSCRGLVGALCNVKNTNDCIAEAYCKGRRGSESTEGMCVCHEVAKEMENRTCVLRVLRQNRTSGFTVKSGGSGNKAIYLGDNFNATKNNIWAIFEEETEEER